MNISKSFIICFWGKRWKLFLKEFEGDSSESASPPSPLALPLFLGPLLNIGGVRLTGTAFHKCNYSESKSFSVEV